MRSACDLELRDWQSRDEAPAFAIRNRTRCHKTPTPSKLVPLSLTPGHACGRRASQIPLSPRQLQVRLNSLCHWHLSCLRNEQAIELGEVIPEIATITSTCGGQFTRNKY